jgi:heme-degrading monooxygenase HmoA
MRITTGSERAYLILWEFRVRRGCERRFQRVYGPRGDWARLFRKGRGYLGTHLRRHPSVKRRYLVLDAWTSRAAFVAFQKRWGKLYKALDRACESLTESEVPLGKFTVST